MIATLRIRLFVAGNSPNSSAALVNLRRLLAGHPSLETDLEVVDVLRTPQRAIDDAILVTPTLLVLSRTPTIRVVGALRDERVVASALGLPYEQEGVA